MGYTYKLSFRLICLLVALSLTSVLFAQTTHTIGTGTATNSSSGYPTPFGDWYEGSRAQYLYTAADLAAAGMQAGKITAVKFNVTSTNSAGVHENYTIALGNSSATSLSASSWESGTSTVWGPVNYTPVAGMNTFTLPTPFMWDGTSNLLVEICHGDASALTSTIYTSNASVAYTIVSYNASHTYRSDNIATGCGIATTTNTGTQTYRPNITFDIISCSEVTGINVSNLQKTSATLSWNAATTSILGYEYVLDQIPSSPVSAGTLTTATSYNATGLTKGTTYYFHVRTKCNATQYSDWATYSFTTPVCFDVTSLQFSNITETTADFSWVASSVATGYEYIVTQDPVLPSSGYVSTNNTSVSLSGLTPFTLYNVFIRARCAGNDSSDWKQYSFTTTSQCAAPAMSATETSTNEWSISWQGVPTAVAYEYALGNGINTPTVGTTVYETNITVAIPDDGQPYYMYARSKCYSLFNTSAWGRVELRAPAGPTSIKDHEVQNLKIYPNPVVNTLDIKAENKVGENATIQVVDLSGKVIYQNAFDGHETIDMSQYAAGIYLIKYVDENSSLVQKINKL